jgi:hypothetical protein
VPSAGEGSTQRHDNPNTGQASYAQVLAVRVDKT